MGRLEKASDISRKKREPSYIYVCRTGKKFYFHKKNHKDYKKKLKKPLFVTDV